MTSRALVSIAAIALCWAAPVAADSVTSEIVAHDRVARVIVLKDKSMLTYSQATVLPEDLKQGDRVEVEYKGSEGDMSVIVAIKRVTE